MNSQDVHIDTNQESTSGILKVKLKIKVKLAQAINSS